MEKCDLLGPCSGHVRWWEPNKTNRKQKRSRMETHFNHYTAIVVESLEGSSVNTFLCALLGQKLMDPTQA